MKELTPREIVKELDKYIVGQNEAKRCVSIAIRNRWRRQQLKEELKDEVAPKNIIMIGPTGVGKTEIARRLANLVGAPFLKVEASRYTEVGYHGRDVESMIRDLVEIAVNMIRRQHSEFVEKKAKKATEKKILDLLLPSKKSSIDGEFGFDFSFIEEEEEENDIKSKSNSQRKRSRDRLRKKLRAGELEKRTVELKVEDKNMPMVEVFSNVGMDQIGFEVQNMFEKYMPGRNKVRKVTVSEAREIILQQETEKLIDKDKIIKESINLTENMGIIFIDEIDKIGGSDSKFGPDVSRQGVQRDLLPIVEGSTVVTRYGMVKTDHILFIAAGAFNVSKPSDLIPELQGRFPIRVELSALKKEDFVRILKEPRNALTRQYEALMETEEINLVFQDKAIEHIAFICEEVNQKNQNIGARRLHTIMEKLLEEISFKGPELKGEKVIINKKLVKDKLSDIVKDEDLSCYIL